MDINKIAEKVGLSSASIDKMLSSGTELGLKLLMGLFLFFIGKKIINMINRLMAKNLEKTMSDKTLQTFISSFLSVLLNGILVIMVVSTIGVQTSSLVALLGAAGLAIGLALQGSLANFAGGVLILLFRPFNVGDFIEVNGFKGTVKDIQIFFTILDTPDNKRVIIPNGDLSNGSITNYSMNTERRVDFTFGIGYDDDISVAKEVLEKIAKNHPLVLQDKEIFVRLANYNNSSIDFAVRVWCKSEDYWAVHFDINEQIKSEFDKANLSIPYPQMDVHLNKLD